MKKLSQKGFSAVEGLLLVVLVVLTTGVGYYVYQQSQKQDETSKPQSTAQAPADADSGDLSSMKVADHVSYTLPDGWKDKDCKGYIQAIIPTDSEDPNCRADQPNTIVTVSVAPNGETGAELGYITTKAACEKQSKAGGVVSRTCTAVTVDGKSGVKEVRKVSDESFYGEAATITVYSFDAGDNIVSTEYIDRTTNPNDNYATDFNTFAQSFMFK